MNERGTKNNNNAARNNNNKLLVSFLIPLGVMLLFGVMGWIANTLMSVNSAIEVLKTEVEAQKMFTNNKTSDRYKGRDAARDFARVDEQIIRIDERLKDLETRIRILETQ